MELHKSQKEVLPFYFVTEQGCIHILWSGQGDQSVLPSNEHKKKKEVLLVY